MVGMICGGSDSSARITFIRAVVKDLGPGTGVGEFSLYEASIRLCWIRSVLLDMPFLHSSNLKSLIRPPSPHRQVVLVELHSS
jgi:hypothetical protein